MGAALERHRNRTAERAGLGRDAQFKALSQLPPRPLRFLCQRHGNLIGEGKPVL